MPCGQTGRLVQACTSRTAPMAPSAIHSQISRLRFGRMALVAHLAGDLVLPGGLGQHPRFVNRMGQGLLHVDVLAPPDSRQGDHGMGMVGRGHDHCVEIFLLIEHDAEILVPLGLRILGKGPGGDGRVQVAKRRDVLVGAVGQVVGAHAADADPRDVEFLARRRIAGTAQHVPGHDGDDRGGRGGPTQEVSSAGQGAAFLSGIRVALHGDLLLSDRDLPQSPSSPRTT